MLFFVVWTTQIFEWNVAKYMLFFVLTLWFKSKQAVEAYATFKWDWRSNGFCKASIVCLLSTSFWYWRANGFLQSFYTICFADRGAPSSSRHPQSPVRPPPPPWAGGRVLLSGLVQACVFLAVLCSEVCFDDDGRHRLLLAWLGHRDGVQLEH